MNCDLQVLAARVEVLEEAVRVLQSSNAELRDQLHLLRNPAGQFSQK